MAKPPKPSIPTPPPPVRIDEWEMRCKFNKAGYWKMVQRGELRAETKSTHRPRKNETENLPWCTSTESAEYFDTDNRKVARVHQYRRSNGKIIKKPDPKELWYEGVLYRQVKGRQSDGSPSKPLWYMRIWGPIRCWLLGR